MAVYKCKMCGGDLEIGEGNVAVCEYCGTKQTVPTLDNERKESLFGRAGRLLRACEFDKASVVFGDIVSEFPDEAEAYWGLLLCKYGVEYVDDPATGKKIPTCHRLSFNSVMEDADFEQALENADYAARGVYREEAKFLEELRRNVIEVSAKEEPYDVFICYKETDANGDRTIDSVMAQDIYNELTEKGLKVFFARITLEDKLGMEYEPYIFAALNSAKVMLAIGTDYEYFNAVWVKNEWSRFLKLMANGEKKVLIPCYKGIDAYDMPKEFRNLQAQDMGKLGFMQDLVRGVCKIVGEKKITVKETVVASSNPSVEQLLKRANMALEDGDFAKADSFCEQALNIDAENAEAYLGKLLAELKVRKKTELADQKNSFAKNANYKKAVKFGDRNLKNELEKYISVIENRNSRAKAEKQKKSKKLLPIAAAAVVLAVVAGVFASNFAFGYSIGKGEEILAYVESEEIYNEAKSIAAGKILESEYTFENEGFVLGKGIVKKENFSDAETVSGMILENSDGIYSAEGFYVDGKFVGTTDSKENWEQILEEYKESFRREGDPSELSFEEEIEFVSGLYETGTFMSTENFKVLLNEGKEGKVYHTVAEGESPSLIADMYGLYYSELTEMNPVLLEKPEVMTGDELLVSEKVPFIKVVSPMSDEELEHLLIYNEAKEIEIKDNASKNKVKELCGKLPEDYPGRAELMKAVEEYEKKNAGTGPKSSLLNKMQGKWIGPTGQEATVKGNSIMVYKNGEIVKTMSGTIVFNEEGKPYLHAMNGYMYWMNYVEPHGTWKAAIYITSTYRFEKA